MKNMKTLLLLSLSLLFVSCIKETKTVSKETNNSGVSDCVHTNSCVPGNGSGTTTSSSGGGTTTTGTGGGDTDWGHLYPDGVPTGTCQPATGSGYATRKALITSSAKYSFFKPSDPITASYVNTDPLVKTEANILQFFSTDSILKVRIKALPEPVSAKTGDTVCTGREGGSTSEGYTKMRITPSVLGIRGDNSRVEIPLETIEIAVNSCNSPAIDLSGYKSMFPNGVYLQIHTIMLNTGANKSFVAVPKTKCWQVQYEVATDTTQTIP